MAAAKQLNPPVTTWPIVVASCEQLAGATAGPTTQNGFAFAGQMAAANLGHFHPADSEAGLGKEELTDHVATGGGPVN